MADPSGLVVGNAGQDGAEFRGWFIGHFVEDAQDLRSTDDVEIKWGIHADREARPAWAASAEATTLSIVIQGQIRLFFASGREALLSKPGDYAVWGPRLAHRWQIEAPDTIVLTVRWPSRAGDAANLDG